MKIVMYVDSTDLSEFLKGYKTFVVGYPNSIANSSLYEVHIDTEKYIVWKADDNGKLAFCTKPQ